MLTPDLAKARIAIVHDQLATSGGAGGAESVLALALQAFPGATVYTTVYNAEKMPDKFRNYGIRTTFIQKLPFAKRHYQWYLPFMPLAIELLDLSEYDIVISFSHSVAKGAITSPNTLHLCYCYSPLRYAWDKYHEYLKYEHFGFLSRLLIPPLIGYLRTWDVISSTRVDGFITLSRFVARRIRKCYRRESTVIYPPCNLSQFHPVEKREGYYLVASRMVSYKRIDLAIEACNRLKRKLIVIGDGNQRKWLDRIAGPTITFLGRVDNQTLASHLARCDALIFPGEEDFGITPVEALASGRPVIAYGSGGALETVRGVYPTGHPKIPPDSSGVFFARQTVDSLVEAIEFFEKHSAAFTSKGIRKGIERFAPERFIAELRNHVEKAYEAFLNDKV